MDDRLTPSNRCLHYDSNSICQLNTNVVLPISVNEGNRSRESRHTSGYSHSSTSTQHTGHCVGCDSKLHNSATLLAASHVRFTGICRSLVLTEEQLASGQLMRKVRQPSVCVRRLATDTLVIIQYPICDDVDLHIIEQRQSTN